ncbi:hypothetical protein BGZ96_001855 [Linnemannia gamsii]|uniref:F-box domain-containing protein n=1 Tax=Linnemannia gamsii TaxID=64522 RepID=A0ABQ7JLQ3_9FUNG|nr:hypothetical protein BGZ96_001855 [Linnemannia gamsii]
MFSRALCLVSRSLASRLPSRGGDSDPDAYAESPFNTLDPNSATTRALALPEILERIGSHLDRSNLVNSLFVSHHFYESLLPVLWFSIQLRIAHPSFPRILEQLEKNLSLIRDLTIEDISKGAERRDDSDNDDDEDTDEDEGGREARGAAFRGYLHRIRSIEILARNDLSLLQCLTLNCGFPTNSASTSVHILNSCLDKFSGLKHLDIGLLSNTRDRLYIHQILDTYPLLESLRVAWSAQSPLLTEDQGPLKQERQQHPTKRLSLRRLHLNGLQWPEQEFLHLVQRSPHLEELTIQGPSKARWDWTVSTVERFAEFCPHIFRLHIDPGYGSDFEDKLLARLLETLSGLRSLHVPRCDLGPRTFKVLKDRIGQMEELNIAFTRKPGVDGSKLVQLMTRARNLRYLDASGVSLDPWLFYVTQQPETHPLSEQDAQEDISECSRLGPQVSTSITSWACRKLEVISIGFATLHVNNRQCHAIYANLSHLPNLRRIHILPNHFPINFESGLRQLASLRQLVHFDAHGTEKAISEDVIKWMGTTWPKLQVLRLYIDGKEKRALALVKSWLRDVGRDDVRVEAD